MPVLHNDLSSLLAQLKIQKQQKGEVARQFKNVEKGSLAHENLLQKMQSVSKLIDETESQIKALEKAALEPSIQEDKKQRIAFDYLEPSQVWPGQINTGLADAKLKNAWINFLKDQLHTPYHKQAWLNLIERVFGHKSELLIAQDQSGAILGGMPLTFFSSKLFGQFAVSIPFINYGGPISQYVNVNERLVKDSTTLLAEFNLSHIEIRSIQPHLHSLCTQKKASMILELPESDEMLEKQLGAKLRSQYKKAENYHPILNIGKLELLDDFYQVFSRNMRDLGTPVYPKHFFAEILKEPEIKSTLLIVKLGKKPVSAAFLIGNNNLLEIPWASTIAEANDKNMNMWMYRKILSYAIAEKFQFFDFGRSTIDAGTYKFKKQWGAEPRQHYWYYVMPEGQAIPEINPNNPKYKLFISLWKLMPVWMTRLIGPLLIKHIP